VLHQLLLELLVHLNIPVPFDFPPLNTQEVLILNHTNGIPSKRKSLPAEKKLLLRRLKSQHRTFLFYSQRCDLILSLFYFLATRFSSVTCADVDGYALSSADIDLLQPLLPLFVPQQHPHSSKLLHCLL
jgi:hypothetical protein